MADISDKAFFDYLMAEYNHPFNGWDFSYLAGRRTDIHGQKTWDYAASVVAAMKQAHSMLDMRTGGGERLARFLALRPVPQVYATEGYPPNVQTARERLEPLGVTVYAVQDEHLPCADDSLDLVINRHGSYDPDEVRRVLCPDKINTAEWLGVVASAHRVGLRTTATIMFGHMEQSHSWAAHLLAVRDLQEITGGFTEFVPLPFVHFEAPLYLKGQARRGPTWRETLLITLFPYSSSDL